MRPTSPKNQLGQLIKGRIGKTIIRQCCKLWATLNYLHD